jgi:S-adenosylmethionine decarboxylase
MQNNEDNASLGFHLMIDIWGEINNTPFFDMDKAGIIFESAAKEAGATVITANWHHFGEGMGYTGVVVLAESHMSVHTWPEKGFAAVDVFMCGNADPTLTMKTLLDFFETISYKSAVLHRGLK